MKIAFIGAGHVGAALAVQLVNRGHQVTLGEARDASKSVAEALKRSALLKAAPLQAAITDAEVVFLTTPFGANEALLSPLAEALSGKILVDCTNPVGPGLSHGLQSTRSGSEFVQALVPGASVVKAFSIYGYENLDDPSFPGTSLRPAMLFCGNDAEAKMKVASLINDTGFEPVDVGSLVQALHLEHMTLLWVRMVRGGGHSPHLTWAALRK